MTVQHSTGALALALSLGAAGQALASPEEDIRTIAALDTAYQAAVECNDAVAIGKILHPNMILVVGDGRVRTGEQLMNLARSGEVKFEKQVEDEGTQVVRLFGPHTATVTARLWLKGERKGEKFDRRLWFTDTYVRTKQGWLYAFGQASMDLPPDTVK